jgi:L-2-hydroxyglutarate oxidase LhgO
LAAARQLVPEIGPGDILPSPKAGIRPQLVDLSRRELVMDFVVEQSASGVHVLNAISPAFTSSMAFARMVCDALPGG